jgi:hypothetical protein
MKKTLDDPIKGPSARQAMFKEMQSMHNLNVFQPLHVGEEKGMKKPIRSHMFFKEKFTPDGKFDKMKGRLVAGGDMQIRDNIFSESTSSPTASIPFVFAIAAIAAHQNRKVITADIPVAYLHADNSHLNITMIINAELAKVLCEINTKYTQYLRKDGTIIVKLLRALYGCIESAKLWYDTLKTALEDNNFKANPIEPCIFNKIYKGQQITVVIYVDDLMLTCTVEAALKETISFLENRFNCELTCQQGHSVAYLGMKFTFNYEKGSVSIGMPAFIKNLLEQENIQKQSTSPAGTNLFCIDKSSKQLAEKEKRNFHTLVAKLLYVAKRHRPDILLTISFLTSRVLNPTEEDQTKLQRLLYYMNHTKELELTLSYDPEVAVSAYIDASYGVHDDGKSHTGMVITLGSGSVDTVSTNQKINTKSSTEAELVGISDKTSKVIWHRNFLIHQGMKMPTSKIHQDNMSTISLIKNGKSNSDRTRHVSLRYFWIKDRVEKGDVEVIYCPTDNMIADMLTKPLVGSKFISFRNIILNIT